MRKLSKIQLKTNEIAMLSLIFLTLIFLFHFWWKNSTMTLTLKALNAQTETSKQKLAENQALFDRLSQRSLASETYSAEYMDQYVLQNERFSSVITGIVKSSKSKSFSLTKISFEEESRENGYKKILYSIRAESSFIEVGKFLEKLEDAPLLTEVSAIEINRIDNEMKRCHAQIKLYSYVRSE